MLEGFIKRDGQEVLKGKEVVTTLNVSQAWWSGRTWETRRQPHANVFNRPPNSVWHGGHSLRPKGRGRHGTEDCYQTGREASYVDCKEDSVTWRIIKLALPDNTVCIFILPHPCGFLHFQIMHHSGADGQLLTRVTGESHLKCHSQLCFRKASLVREEDKFWSMSNEVWSSMGFKAWRITHNTE